MSDNKKYYYMKLKENFFDSDEMIVLESMPDGYLYTNILMKLYLRSLKDNGCLMFKGVIPYTPDVLARVVRHNVGVVEKAIEIFKKFGLVEILDNGAIYMMDIQNFIGESSTEADRIRAYRKTVSELKQISVTNDVTNDVQMYDKSTPEIEIDIEIDLEIKKELKDTVPKGTTRTKTIPPTIEDVKAYCEERNNGVDPGRWYNHYTANGWMVGKNKMKDWKASVRTWEKTSSVNSTSTVGRTGQAAYRNEAVKTIDQIKAEEDERMQKSREERASWV